MKPRSMFNILKNNIVKKEVSFDQVLDIAMFIFSFIGFAILTFLSWLLAFGNDEGGTSVIGTIGYYSFNIFRFPSHNFFWSNNEYVTNNYFSLLLVNIFFYSLLLTLGVSVWRRRKAKLAHEKLLTKDK